MLIRSLLLCGLLAIAWAKSGNVKVTIRPLGPRALLTLQWPTQQCLIFHTMDYFVRICDGVYCFSEYPVAKSRGKVSYDVSRPLYFWKRYNIEVYAICARTLGYVTVGAFPLNVGPGELQPLKSLAVEPDQRSATVTWQEHEPRQNASTHVRIKLCTGAQPTSAHCPTLDTVDKTQEQYVLTNLIPGYTYTVKLRLERVLDGVRYTSSEIVKSFQCKPPRPDEYPPVPSLTVHVNRRNRNVTAEIQITKPARIPNYAQLVGFAVRLKNHQEKDVFDPFRTNSSTVVFTDIPSFSHMTVQVHALYAVGAGTIWSAMTVKKFNTGAGELEAPKLLSLQAVSDSQVLVEWSHTSRDSDELSYVVYYRRDDDVDHRRVPAAQEGSNYALLGGLDSNTDYRVQVIALVQVDAANYSETSAEQLVRTLPQDALVPVVKADPVVVYDGIELAWKIIGLPTNSANCSLSAAVCSTSGSCKYALGIPASATKQLVKFYRFDWNSITVSTRCHYKTDVEIVRTSKRVKLFGGFALAAPSQLSGNAQSPNSIHVSFKAAERDAKYVAGYLVRWQALNNLSRADEWFEKRTLDQYLNIRKLLPYTSYNISVAAYGRGDDGRDLYTGQAAYIKVTTQLPAPPAIENLNATRHSATTGQSLNVTWTIAAYPYTNLRFRVQSSCGSDESSDVWTQKTATMVAIRDKFHGECTVTVTASTDIDVDTSSGVVPQHGPSAKVVILINSIPTPLDLRLLNRTNSSLALKAVATTDSNAVPLDHAFTYQLAVNCNADYVGLNQSSPVFVLKSLEPYSMYCVKARLCIDDVCGGDLIASFRTNVAAPQAVAHLRVTTDVHVIHARWMRPLEPRGPIDGYAVYVKSEHDGSVRTLRTNATTTHVEILAERELAWYEVAVCALNFDLDSNGTELLGVNTTARIRTTEYPTPQAITVTERSEDTLRLTVSAPPNLNASLYRYQLALADRDYEQDPQEDGYFVLTSLKAHTVYVVKARLCVEQNVCGNDLIDSFATNVGAPGKVASLQVSARARTIYVNWTRPTEPRGPIDQYHIDVKDGEGRTVMSTTTNGSTTWAKLSVESEFTRYEVIIAAVNFDLNQGCDPIVGDTSSAMVQTGGCPLPQAITLSNRSGNTLWLNVDAPKNASTIEESLYSYQLTRRDIEYTESRQASSEFVLDSLEPYTAYEVKARLCIDDDCGQDRIASFTTNVGVARPVEDLRASCAAGRLHVGWYRPSTPNGPIDGYLIEVRNTENSSSRVFTTNSTTTEVEISAMNALTWQVSVGALNFDLDSRDKAIIGINTTLNACCKEKMVPHKIEITQRSEDTLSLTVMPPSGIDRSMFRYQLALENTTYDVGSQSNVFVIKDLRPYTSYTFKARLCWQDLCSSDFLASLTTNVGVPQAVSRLHVASNETMIHVAWARPIEPRGPVDYYLIQAKLFKNDTTWNFTRTGDATQMDIPRKPYEFGRYEVTVSAVNLDLDESGVTHVGVNTSMIIEISAPPLGPVRLLRAWQVADPLVVLTSWEPPHDVYGELDYIVDVSCRDSRAAWSGVSRNTSVEFKLQARASDLCRVDVTPRYISSSEAIRGQTSSVSFRFRGIDRPYLVKVRNPGPGLYRFVIVATQRVEPPVTFTYQLTEKSSPYNSTSLSSSITRTYREAFVHKDMLARVCLEGFCSDDYPFSFITNTEEPGPVRSVKVRISFLTNFVLSWQEPQLQRGPINGYTVRILDQESQLSWNFTSTGTSLKFTSKNEYASYNVSIYAFNFDIYNKNVQLNGPVLWTTVTTQGKRAPPLKAVQVERASSDSLDLRWETSQLESPVNVTMFRVEYKLRLQGNSSELATVNDEQKSAVDDTLGEIYTNETHITLRPLRAYSTYSLGVSACSSTLDCGRQTTTTFTTKAGSPSQPQIVSVVVNESTVHIEWSPPENPEGPLDGYSFALCPREREDCPLEDEWTLINSGTVQQVNISLEDFTSKTGDKPARLVLRAYNKVDGNLLFSPTALMEIRSEDEHKLGTSAFPWTGLFALATVGLLVFVVVGTLLCRISARLSNRYRSCGPMLIEDGL